MLLRLSLNFKKGNSSSLILAVENYLDLVTGSPEFVTGPPEFVTGPPEFVTGQGVIILKS